MKRIRLFAEYHCNSPVWGDVDEGDFEFEELFDLGLSGDLISSLRTWQYMWDATFVSNDPASSRFHTKEEELEFERLGLYILLELRKQLPNYVISYYSNFFQRQVILGGLN